MPAPTFVSEQEVAAWNVTTTPRSLSATITVADGDLITVIAGTEAGATTLAAPTDNGPGLTYAQVQAVNPGASNCRAYLWTATVGAGQGGTFNISIVKTAGSGWWGFNGTVHRDSAGFGASAGNSGTGAPSLALVATGDNSAIVGGYFDWNADTGARTWRAINGITPTAVNGHELVFASTTNYRGYIAKWPDAGAAGSETTGLTQPTGTKWTGVAIEILGADDGITGTITATFPALTGALTATATADAALTGALPPLAASLTAVAASTATIAANLPALSGDIAATAAAEAELDATLPGLTASVTAEAAAAGTLSASLPALAAALTGSAGDSATGVLSATLPALTGALDGRALATATGSATLPALAGSFDLTATAGAILTAVLPMLEADLVEVAAVGAGPRITASTPAGRITTSTPPRYTTSTAGGRL